MPDTYFEKINRSIQEAHRRRGEMTQEMIIVMDAIVAATRSNRKVSQREIADSEPWLGCHTKFEGELIAKNKQHESTLRQVRQIIHDLRVDFGIPIISDHNGYWIPTNESDANAFIERLEAETKASIASKAQTYKALRNSLNVQQSSLFENVLPDTQKVFTPTGNYGPVQTLDNGFLAV